MPEPGLFITVEGGEGVGKTTFINHLTEKLTPHLTPYKLIKTREPGGTRFAEAIRQLFLLEDHQESWLPISEACLVSAARAQHVKFHIQPNIAAGNTVVCDRFTDSTQVYQGMVGGADLHVIKQLTIACCDGLQPDLTLVLDCPIEIAKNRLDQRNSTDEASRYDCKNMAFHERIRQNFLELAAKNSGRMIVIDTSHTPAQAVESAMKHIQMRLIHN